jgi:hypothetical protein
VSCPACAGECVDLLEDVRHCGACGVSCDVAHGSPGCLQGTCVVNGCDEGFVVLAARCVLSTAEPRDEKQEMLAFHQGSSCRVTGDGPWLAAALAWVARRIRRSGGAGAQA